VGRAQLSKRARKNYSCSCAERDDVMHQQLVMHEETSLSESASLQPPVVVVLQPEVRMPLGVHESVTARRQGTMAACGWSPGTPFEMQPSTAWTCATCSEGATLSVMLVISEPACEVMRGLGHVLHHTHLCLISLCTHGAHLQNAARCPPCPVS
jgi:hypothetical protein